MTEKARILIVDDEPINVKIVEHALCDTYDTISACNGYEAIRIVKKTPPDLILLDVMMPDLNGFDVCRIIKADERLSDIPVLFLTAMDSVAGEIMGLELGGTDYLAKPVNLDLLKLRVRNHIELKKRNDLIREQRNLLAQQKDELESSLKRIKQLEGIIPICMFCKNIRSEDTSWEQIETYITDHTDAFFSHGICPSCLAKNYPELVDKMTPAHGGE